jgi:biopolymer transport protein ExbD
MAMTAGVAEGAPMSEINTTPLIDVMLVLLIMFILTIPLQTHAVKVDLPQGPVAGQDIRPKNDLAISAQGQVSWNGTAIDLATLRTYLALTVQMAPEPELHFRPDPQAPYGTVDKVLAVAKRSGVTKLGLVGNEGYAQF